jgi:hypothetical protein
MQKFGMILILALTLTLPSNGMARNLANYMIMQDIGSYKFMGKGGGGQGAGFLAPTGHFSKDHTDESYDGSYIDRSAKIGVNVEVTKHAGTDSDKWLQHEVEMALQKGRTLGAAYAAPNPLKEINGNKIYFIWGHYKWISNNVVISVDFTDLTGTKPEPLEIVQAYLQKFPSTISTSLVLDNKHKIQWIKDEMERRLWLCDKWFYQLQLGKVQQSQVFQESVESMNIFLDYREKYYGLKAADEKNLLAGYLNANNGTAIKAKLTEYKNWWTVNKDKAISL